MRRTDQTNITTTQLNGMKQYITTLLLLFTLASQAQRLVSGRVVDGYNQQPVEYAMVQLVPSGQLLAADKEGFFSVPVSGDTARLLITGIGYKAQRATLTAGLPNQTVALDRGMVDLKELVLTATHTGQNLISKIDLHLRPVKSAQELLRNVPGLFIAQHQGGGKAEQIFLRGFDIDHGTDIAIAVDGMPVNMVSHAHGQGYADMHFIIPELVKKIDYGKGPYNISMGNLNTAGHVQLETLDKLDANRVQAEAGSFNTFRGLAMLKLLDGQKQNAYIASELLYSNGPFANPQGFNRFNAQLRYNAQPAGNAQFSFIASALNSRWDAGGQLPQRAVDAGLVDRFGQLDAEGGYTGRINATAKLSQQWQRSSLQQQVYYSRYHFNLYSNFTFFLNDSINGDQIRQREKRDIWGYQARYERKGQWGRASATTILGMGIRHDQTRGSELAHTQYRKLLLGRTQWGDIAETNGWAYAEERLALGKWVLQPGIRADFFSFGYKDRLTASASRQNRAIVSPRFTAQYNAAKNLQLFAKLGKGFHSNDARVVLDNTAREILPAVYGTDIGFSYKPLPKLFVQVAAWHLASGQEFVYVGDEGIVEPGGRSRRSGVDLSLRYQLGQHFFADVNGNWARARAVGEPKGSDFIPLAPRFTSTGGLQYQATKGFTGSLRYRYIQNRPANEDGSVTALGYFVADAALQYRAKGYELGLVAENIFNTRWNEAQFETTSRLRNEAAPVTELHFTPGNPFFVKATLAINF
jgi:outer membrane cobalamin receptor